jgi:tetratricopeptide (TPR) repeat protein
MAVTRGDLAAARPFLEESLAVWRRLGSAEVVHTLTSLGYLAAREGDKAAEQASYEEALRLARGAGNRRFTLYPLRGLGDLARGRGDLPAAEAYLEESVAVAREFGDHKGLIWSLASLADVKSDRGDGAGADALREESAAVAAELRDSRSLLGTLPQVAHRAMLRGEYARARALYGRCLEAAREVEDVCAVGWGMFDLAVVAQHEGDYAQARRLFDEGLPLIRRAADEFMAAVAACQAPGTPGGGETWRRRRTDRFRRSRWPASGRRGTKARSPGPGATWRGRFMRRAITPWRAHCSGRPCRLRRAAGGRSRSSGAWRASPASGCLRGGWNTIMQA